MNSEIIRAWELLVLKNPSKYQIRNCSIFSFDLRIFASSQETFDKLREILISLQLIKIELRRTGAYELWRLFDNRSAAKRRNLEFE